MGCRVVIDRGGMRQSGIQVVGGHPRLVVVVQLIIEVLLVVQMVHYRIVMENIIYTVSAV